MSFDCAQGALRTDALRLSIDLLSSVSPKLKLGVSVFRAIQGFQVNVADLAASARRRDLLGMPGDNTGALQVEQVYAVAFLRRALGAHGNRPSLCARLAHERRRQPLAIKRLGQHDQSKTGHDAVTNRAAARSSSRLTFSGRRRLCACKRRVRLFACHRADFARCDLGLESLKALRVGLSELYG